MHPCQFPRARSRMDGGALCMLVTRQEPGRRVYGTRPPVKVDTRGFRVCGPRLQHNGFVRSPDRNPARARPKHVVVHLIVEEKPRVVGGLGMHDVNPHRAHVSIYNPETARCRLPPRAGAMRWSGWSALQHSSSTTAHKQHTSTKARFTGLPLVIVLLLRAFGFQLIQR